MFRIFCISSLLSAILITLIQSEQILVPSVDGVLEEVSPEEAEQFVPFFVPESDMIFHLFTRNNPNESQTLIMDHPESVHNSHYNRNHPTRFTIHGWTGDGEASMNVNIRDAYMELGDFNVIFVDWGAGAQTPNYIAARNRVGPTGTHLGAFIRFLSATSGASTRDFTVIGYSLGAHVAGFAGKALTGQFRLGAIVSLDAARPLFSADRPDQRVDVRDADYVESIHTNGGMLGLEDPLGHASFYPNFGRRQPGCGIDPAGGCAHGRAPRFFTESLTTTVGFYARQCRSVNDVTRGNCVQAGPDVRMGGEPTDKGARGVFWLPTNSRPAFAKGDSWLEDRIWSRQRWLLIVSLSVGIPIIVIILIICFYTKNKRLNYLRCSSCPCRCNKKRKAGRIYDAGVEENQSG